MSKAVIEITSTGEDDKVNIEVSFNGEVLNKANPAHLVALRITEAIYRGRVHEEVSASDEIEVRTTEVIH